MSSGTMNRTLDSRAYAALCARIGQIELGGFPEPGITSADLRPAIGVSASTQAEYEQAIYDWEDPGDVLVYGLFTPLEDIRLDAFDNGGDTIDFAGLFDHIIVDAPPCVWCRDLRQPCGPDCPKLNPAHADAIVEQVVGVCRWRQKEDPLRESDGARYHLDGVASCKRPALAVIGEVGCGRCHGMGKVLEHQGFTNVRCPIEACNGTGRVPYTYKGKRWLEVTCSS